jgi:hypothetical protein
VTSNMRATAAMEVVAVGTSLRRATAGTLVVGVGNG